MLDFSFKAAFFVIQTDFCAILDNQKKINLKLIEETKKIIQN